MAMTAPEADDTTGPHGSPDAPLSTLRGAGVDIDARLVGRALIGLCLVALAVLVVIFTVAGVHKNSQINSLRDHGVPVEITVTKCLGLLGGSGSNAAGYSCTGSFTLDGRIYSENIPGTDYHDPHSSLRAIVVPGDPALLSTPGILATEHASAGVFIVPGVLLVVLLLLVAVIAVRRRAKKTAAG
jgi:hypothetical protein